MGSQGMSLQGIATSCLLTVLLAAPLARAQTKPKAPAQASDGKVDISDLENKYWAPKDTDFSVVQNRTYSKENRYFLSAELGRPINDQWSTGNAFAVTGNYFWSERMGVQATYLKAGMQNNSATDQLTHYGSGVAPDHNRLDTYYGVGLDIVPFYAKMSFWGKRIIYFDMAITPTIGMTNYEQQISTGNQMKSAFTYGVDITQYFFFTNYFAIRADLKNQWHSENIAAYNGNSAQGTVTGGNIKSDTAQDTIFLVGFTFFY